MPCLAGADKGGSGRKKRSTSYAGQEQPSMLQCEDGPITDPGTDSTSLTCSNTTCLLLLWKASTPYATPTRPIWMSVADTTPGTRPPAPQKLLCRQLSLGARLRRQCMCVLQALRAQRASHEAPSAYQAPCATQAPADPANPSLAALRCLPCTPAAVHPGQTPRCLSQF